VLQTSRQYAVSILADMLNSASLDCWLLVVERFSDLRMACEAARREAAAEEAAREEEEAPALNGVDDRVRLDG
jgi:hypothetical protein